MCSNAGKMVSIENGPNIASPPSRRARRRSGTVWVVWADGMGDGRGKLTAFVGEVSAAPAEAATRGRPSYAADRKSVAWGKGVSVRVGLGGRRSVKKKKQ